MKFSSPDSVQLLASEIVDRYDMVSKYFDAMIRDCSMYSTREAGANGKSNDFNRTPNNSFSLSGTNSFRAALNFSIVLFHSLLYWGSVRGISYNDSIKARHARNPHTSLSCNCLLNHTDCTGSQRKLHSKDNCIHKLGS